MLPSCRHAQWLGLVFANQCRVDVSAAQTDVRADRRRAEGPGRSHIGGANRPLDAPMQRSFILVSNGPAIEQFSFRPQRSSAENGLFSQAAYSKLRLTIRPGRRWVDAAMHDEYANRHRISLRINCRKQPGVLNINPDSRTDRRAWPGHVPECRSGSRGKFRKDLACSNAYFVTSPFQIHRRRERQRLRGRWRPERQRAPGRRCGMMWFLLREKRVRVLSPVVSCWLSVVRGCSPW